MENQQTFAPLNSCCDGDRRTLDPVKILIAATPLAGHLNPLLALARILIEGGHEVLGLSASAMRDRIVNVGAEFRAFPAGADFDPRRRDVLFPEWKSIPAGLERTRFALKHIYVDAIQPQHAGLLQALREFPADVVIGDNFFWGALPMLLGPRGRRPAVILCGVMPLHSQRDDGAPPFAGLAPATSDTQRKEYAAKSEALDRDIYDPVKRHLNTRLIGMGVEPLSMHLLDAVVTLPDAYLQLTVPDFEFPRRNLPASVRFIGTPPLPPHQAPLPPWAHGLDGSRKVALVTQGTLSNLDLGQLVAPTLAALADRPDLLVIVTTGGPSFDAIPGVVPGNARLATYLPFDRVLPKVDVLVTNGGYGTVNLALSQGVPIVTAGLTEDKADVGARVAWSKVGIDLATNNPTPQALHRAVREVLGNPDYRARAASLAKVYAEIDTRCALLRILNQVTR
jgi:UDP:flavonoid glycosyltransferase YjiC (YdhE family)